MKPFKVSVVINPAWDADLLGVLGPLPPRRRAGALRDLARAGLQGAAATVPVPSQAPAQAGVAEPPRPPALAAAAAAPAAAMDETAADAEAGDDPYGDSCMLSLAASFRPEFTGI